MSIPIPKAMVSVFLVLTVLPALLLLCDKIIMDNEIDQIKRLLGKIGKAPAKVAKKGLQKMTSRDRTSDRVEVEGDEI